MTCRRLTGKGLGGTVLGMTMRRSLFAVLALLFAFVVPAAGRAATVEPLTIVDSAGQRHLFQVELALTEEERERGLMFRDHLAADGGMIFLYARPTAITMWMKNTPIALDMLFMDGHGTITHIAADAVPYSLTYIPSGGPAVGVLEV
ncbi:DUF192 domain-containing protein, partial [Zavarzinia sp.]|uniref:DUF192 domain-containing protein n=1 Tax=Zavarzinia sp. TaxID=2027920 RepID=UPI003563A85E